jgi:hypothetical protein
MHIHPAAIGLHPMSTYAAGSEHAAAAERAAEVRKRLLKAAQSVNADASPEESLLIGRWLDPPNLDQPQNQVQPASGYRFAVEGKDSNVA